MATQREREEEAMYVVVSIADNGIVHAWGEGPVVDPSGDQVEPFLGRTRARSVAARMRREEKARKADGEEGTVTFKVCKVLGIEPVEVKIVSG